LNKLASCHAIDPSKSAEEDGSGSTSKLGFLAGGRAAGSDMQHVHAEVEGIMRAASWAQTQFLCAPLV